MFDILVDIDLFRGYNSSTIWKGGEAVDPRELTCCFTGHRPAKLPWKNDESDRRCLALKAAIAQHIRAAYDGGWRHFICGMALGCDLYFCEAALALRESCPDLRVEAAVPCPSQADHWTDQQRARRAALLDRCDWETLVQHAYAPGCMMRRNRYMVDHASLVIAVFDGTPGGTQATLAYAMSNKVRTDIIDMEGFQ